MDKAKNIIGISAGLCTPEFLDMLVSAINKCQVAASKKPEVISVSLDWKEAPANAHKRVQIGYVKCRLYEEIRSLAAAGAKVVAIPNFAPLTYIHELQTECVVPLASMGTAIAMSFKGKSSIKLGYLGDPTIEKARAIKNCFKGVAKVEWVDPDAKETALLNKFMDLVFSKTYSKKDVPTALKYLHAACANLVAKGADVILPTCIRQAALVGQLTKKGYKLVDIPQCYAEYLCKTNWKPLPKPFKIGIVGGLGPLASVDLYDKITRATPAKNDQEHFKIVIEQNPQVPDRTKHLLGEGDDPTLPLYAACKKLEADEVDIIIFPCNTAHAYIDHIAPHLSVPMLDMQKVTAEEIKAKFGAKTVVGLMATDGTCQSGLYDVQIKKLGMKYVKPDAKHQKLVMEAIYGERGVKAGHREGLAKEQLLKAAEYLVSKKGATVLILGCTELPILLKESDAFKIGGKTVGVVDPTAATARYVVKHAQEVTKQRGRR